jgi:hypothetical protein
MKVRDIERVVPRLFDANIVPLLWGSHGIGKTEVAKQIGAALDMEVIYLTFGACEDVGDIIGLQNFVQVDGKEFTEHAAPSWFPKEGNKLIFIDEFNRANNQIMQAMFPFILEGRLHTHKLPENCKVILAANPPTEDYQVNNFEDNALFSRMCHLKFEPDHKDFTSFLERSDAPSVFKAYVDNYKEDFEYTVAWEPDFLSNNNRAVTMCMQFYMQHKGKSDFEKDFRAACVGMLGNVDGIRLAKYVKENDRYFTVEEMLSSFKNVESKLAMIVEQGKNDVLGKLILDIMLGVHNKTIKLNKSNTMAIFSFFSTLPEELKFKFLSEYAERGLIELDSALSEIPEMVEICDGIYNKTKGAFKKS